MCAPLFSRPVIINMMHQWLKSCLQQRKKERIDRRDEKEFLKNLDVIVESFLESVLSKDQLPDIMIGKKAHAFGRLPTLGYLAIYTLNLILLRTMFDPDGYTFIEIEETAQKERFPSQDGTRAWDRLTYLWRSWFSLETLNGLAAIFTAEREGEKVHLKMESSTTRIYSRLTQVRNVSRALADNVTAGLSGLLLYDTFEGSETELDDIRKKLDGESIELNEELFTKQLRHLKREKTILGQEVVLLFEKMVHQVILYPHSQEAIASFFTEMVRVTEELNDIHGIKIEKVRLLDIFLGINSITLEEFRLARKINDQPFIDVAINDFLSMGINNRYLPHDKVATESIAFIELLTEITKFVREYGNWSNPKYLALEDRQKQFLHSHKGRIPTTLVVEMIRLAYEAGNREILNYFSQHYYSYLEEMVDPEKSVSVDLAIELVKLAREKGDRDALDYFARYLDRSLKERSEVPSALVIEVIKLAYEVNDRKTLTRFLEEYVHAIIDVRSIPCALLVELLKLADESSNQAILQQLRTYCGKMIAGNRHIPHDLASVMIKLARKADDKDILGYFNRDYLGGILQEQGSVPVELVIELVKLMQESHTYDQMSIDNFYRKNINVDRCYLDLLPVNILVDLRHLAQQFHDDEMLSKIQQKAMM